MTFLSKASTLMMGLLVAMTIQAQTCYDTIKETAPTARYTLLGGGTEVHDTLTGLTWKRCPEGLSGIDCSVGSATAHTWAAALALSDTTWRLPNIKELTSLVETACYNPAINLKVFPNTPLSSFWSSSPYANNGSNAWFVAFGYGLGATYDKNGNRYVRLVRSGQ